MPEHPVHQRTLLWSSCCLLLRYRLTQELQLLNIPLRRKDKLELQLRHVQHSFLFGEDDGYVLQEIVAQHEMIVTWPWSLFYLLCRVLTFFCYLNASYANLCPRRSFID